MKKFYTPIFTAVLILISFLLEGQVFNSITSNPNGYTLDDIRFWQGGIQPGNPCNNCTIKIFSDVTMVKCCGFSTAVNPVASSVFTSQTPASSVFNDLPVTLGMRFQPSVAGSINGVRFYKEAGMNGPHIGVLYDNAGGIIRTVNFASETASGWQTQNFAIPFTATAGATYVIAVYFSDGNYLADHLFFATSGVTNGVLTALQDGTPDPNGVFTYGAAPAFPTSTSQSSNYWVDINFSGSDGIWLNDVVLNGGTINVYGSTTLTFNTYVQLFNTSITIGNDPVSQENIKLNDQVDLNGSAAIILANNLTAVDATDIGLRPIAGPHTDFPAGSTSVSPGLYAIIPPDVNGFNYTWTLDEHGLGKSTAPYLPNGNPYYGLNCLPFTTGSPSTCGPGLVFGPATTTLDASFGLIFAGSTPLPVVLVQFLATKNDDGTIKISWATSQEENSDYYNVERSGDQSVWSSIGTVKARGYSSTTTNYFLTDKSPLDGTGYYRLKMVDLDGKFTYSKAIPVTTDNSSLPLVIYSNPFSDQIRLKVNVSRPQNLILTVTDLLGKTYISQSYQAQSGDNFVNLQPSAGSSGMYILRIQGDSYDQTVKLEKQ
jgi:Domain of unknown function (DUF4082)/Secretion system C-terminal sorting domain